MSAENRLDFLRLSGDRVWIVMWVEEFISRIVYKATTFEEANAAMERFDNEEHPDFIYTEHGCAGPLTLETLERMPVSYEKSQLRIESAQSCPRCVHAMLEDCQEPVWSLHERDLMTGEERVIVENISFFAVLAIGNQYRVTQPKVSVLGVPTMRSRAHHKPKSCRPDDCLLELPGVRQFYSQRHT